MYIIKIIILLTTKKNEKWSSIVEIKFAMHIFMYPPVLENALLLISGTKLSIKYLLPQTLLLSLARSRLFNHLHFIMAHFHYIGNSAHQNRSLFKFFVLDVNKVFQQNVFQILKIYGLEIILVFNLDINFWNNMLWLLNGRVLPIVNRIALRWRIQWDFCNK